MFKLKNSTYDFLKWFALICIPAFEAFWLTVGKIWNFPYLTEIGATMGAVGILIAALLGISSKNYYDDLQSEIGAMGRGESEEDNE